MWCHWAAIHLYQFKSIESINVILIPLRKFCRVYFYLFTQGAVGRYARSPLALCLSLLVSSPILSTNHSVSPQFCTPTFPSPQTSLSIPPRLILPPVFFFHLSFYLPFHWLALSTYSFQLSTYVCTCTCLPIYFFFLLF